MKQRTFIWLMIVMTGLFLTGCNQAGNKLTEQEKQEGWVLLFDGKTLAGWRDFKGTSDTITAPWKVEKGTLASLGNGSDSTGYIWYTEGCLKI